VVVRGWGLENINASAIKMDFLTGDVMKDCGGGGGGGGGSGYIS